MAPVVNVGPDGARYLHLAAGNQVPRPFHLRWLLPKVCGVNPVRWWAVWLASWLIMFAAMFVWQSSNGWRVALASAVLLAGLPGILGPAAVIPVGVKFDAIAAHPIRAALAAHRGRWRDGWLMVAPWGACLLALHGTPTWPIVAVIVVAYLQLLVATDTVRLLHHAAGPPLAAAAAVTIPVAWLPLACIAHVAWWYKIERV